MNATVVDIKAMLEYYKSTCDTDLYPIYIGKEPDTPINTITLFETGVFPQDLTFDRTEIYEKPSVQIRVRSTGYLEGWAIISQIKDILHGRAGESWNGAVYTLIRCSSGPALLDYDKAQRVRFIINFYIQRK